MSWKQLSCFLLLSISISSLFLGDLPTLKAETNSESEVLDPQWTITTTSCSSPIRFNNQRKTFFSCGWQFVFYSNGSDMLYRAVECHWDLLMRSPQVVRKGNDTSMVSDGSQFSICWDGTYVHYALFLPDPSGGKLFYRRGIPYPNATIIWEDEQTVGLFVAEGLQIVPVITVDSNGYPWIGIRFSHSVLVFKASVKDGSSWDWMDVPLSKGKEKDTLKVLFFSS